MVNRKSIQIRAPGFYLLIGMIGGLNAAQLWDAPLFWLLVGASALALVTLTKIGNKRLWPLLFIAASTLTFWAYGIIRLPQHPDALALSLPPREAKLTLEVQRVLQVENRFGESTGIAKVISAPRLSRLTPKTPIYFRLKLPEDESVHVARRLQLKATGVLTPILHYDEGNFNSYLKSIGIHYRFNRAVKMEIIRPLSAFDQFCKKMNARFQGYLHLGKPEVSEIANIYSAMLLGRKIELTKKQMERYQMTGTMHFFAISGLHIGVIATVIFQFLSLIRVPRALNPLIGLPLLFLYVEITGAAPSAVRAFLMVAFFWASFACQRQRNSFAALIGSAIFVLLIQPPQLWSIGFQLSYYVVLSILLLGLPLYEQLNERFQLFQWLPKDSWTPIHYACAWSSKKLCLFFAISFSAWLASTPLSAQFFGFIAPGAIFLNMLLVNLVALAIITGILSLTSALLLPLAGCTFLNHSAWIVISLMDKIVILFTHIPGAVVSCDDFPTKTNYLTLSIYFSLLLWHHHNKRTSQLWRLLAGPTVLLGIIAVGLLVQ